MEPSTSVRQVKGIPRDCQLRSPRGSPADLECHCCARNMWCVAQEGEWNCHCTATIQAAGAGENSQSYSRRITRHLPPASCFLTLCCPQVLETCMVTVGRMSNVDHNKRIIGKAGRNRWLGIRPSSGKWKRKGGWAGRKIRPLPPMKSFVSLPSAKQ